jgi:hypothetical protein
MSDNPVHDPVWMRDECGEPCLSIERSQLEQYFSTEPCDVAWLRDFWSGKVWSWGSRKGRVGFFLVALEEWDWERLADEQFASAAAQIWQEGKRSSAIVEFGLAEEDAAADRLAAIMARFRGSPLIMSDADLAALDALPPRLYVWRGGAGEDADIQRGHSWTTDRQVAEKFAAWTNGKVVRRRIRKSQVIAYFTERDEHEVVLLPLRGSATP